MKPPKGKLFRPLPHLGSWVTLLLAFLSLILGFWLAIQVPGHSISGPMFWLMFGILVFLGLSIHLFYRSFALFRLTYLLNRNGLEIRWGAIKQRIPIENISNITPLANTDLPNQRLLGIPLPAWWSGQWGNTRYYATASAKNSLAVQTRKENYIISPDSQYAFLEAWKQRLPLGPTQIWKQTVIRHPLIAQPIWHDKLALRIGAGAILLCLILLGSAMTAYPTWPATVRIQLGPQNQSTTIANPEQLLIFPVSGLIILAFNLTLGLLLYNKNPLITYILWAIAILVQIGLWLTIRYILG